MSATVYEIGKGSSISISTDGTTFTPIKQLKTVTYNGSKADFDDITNMDSSGAYREWAPTILDAGTVDFQGVFAAGDPGQIAVTAAFDSQTLIHVKHQFAARTGETTGFLKAFTAYVAARPDIDAQFDKTSTFKGSLKITGPITDTQPVLSA